jgi:hypothetical protein
MKTKMSYLFGMLVLLCMGITQAMQEYGACYGYTTINGDTMKILVNWEYNDGGGVGLSTLLVYLGGDSTRGISNSSRSITGAGGVKITFGRNGGELRKFAKNGNKLEGNTGQMNFPLTKEDGALDLREIPNTTCVIADTADALQKKLTSEYRKDAALSVLKCCVEGSLACFAGC